MAKRKPEPIITHTEILCYAIRHLAAHVDEWRRATATMENAEEALADICGREMAQIAALKELYFIETGATYGD